MRLIVRTIYGSALQTSRHMGILHDVLPYTTLTELVNEEANVPLVVTQGMEVVPAYDANDDTASMVTRYFCIGNGGHRVQLDGNSIPYNAPIPHKATDSGLYNIIPFIVRETTNDLTPAERQKYRIRRTLSIDGVLYAAYYGRVIDLTSVIPDMIITTIVSGNPVNSSFVPSANNLEPTVPPIGSTNDGSNASVSATVIINMPPDETQEIVDACNLLYGNGNLAIISEIAIVAAVDKQVTHRYPDTGAQVPVAVVDTIYEAVAPQVQTHISTSGDSVADATEYGFTLDLGAAEALYGVNV